MSGSLKSGIGAPIQILFFSSFEPPSLAVQIPDNKTKINTQMLSTSARNTESSGLTELEDLLVVEEKVESWLKLNVEFKVEPWPAIENKYKPENVIYPIE